MEAAVMEGDRSGWQRHRGCAVVKRNLNFEFDGIKQCIGAMAVQVAQNWTLEDEADAIPAGKRVRVSEDGETVIIEGPGTACAFVK